jgi:hypothetical protein
MIDFNYLQIYKHSRSNLFTYGHFLFSLLIYTCYLIAPACSSRSEAAEKFLEAFRVRSGDAFSQHSLLAELEHTHPHLFHHLLVHHFEEVAVAMIGRGVTAGCLRYGDIPKKRGALHLSIKDLGTVYQQLKNQVDRLSLQHGELQYRVLVVSDGEVKRKVHPMHRFRINVQSFFSTDRLLPIFIQTVLEQ